MNVKELRKLTGASQEQFARKLGVSVRSVAGWEAGTTKPSPLGMEKLVALKRGLKRR